MSKEISEAGLFILGIIADRPTTPYMIDKLINYKRKNNIKVGIPLQTIYGLIYKFKKEGLISRRRMRNRNLPEKTIYSITPKGEELFKQSLINYICRPPEIISELVLPIMMIKHLDSETAIKVLGEYKEKIGKEITIGRKLKSTSKELKEALTGQLFLEHSLGTLSSNRRIINKLIKMIKEEPRWSECSIPWWRDDVEEK
jgi:DNA-binding PadR family transcriptional regulator